SARNFFLTQSTLRVSLRCGDRFFELNLARSFDADALQSDARHLAAGRELALHLRRRESIVHLLFALGNAATILVAIIERRVVGVRRPVAVLDPITAFLSPSANTRARIFAERIVTAFFALALAPAFALANALRRFVEIFERRHH